MTEHVALTSFREEDATLGDGREARLRARIAELTRDRPDVDGHSPFRDLEALPAPVTAATWWQGRHLAGVAAALVVAALISGGVALRASVDDDGNTQIGAESLAGLAGRAAQQPDRPLVAGEQLHQRWEKGSTPDGSATERTVLSGQWSLAADGTGQVVGGISELLDTESGQRTQLDPGYSQDVRAPGGPVFDNLTYDQLRGLPTEPEALLDVVQAHRSIGEGHVDVLAAEVVHVLMLGIVPPAARAAAFEALASLGAEPVDARLDQAGRTGFAFTVPGRTGPPLVVVVDPATTEVWEASSGSGPEGEAPTTWYTVVDQSRRPA